MRPLIPRLETADDAARPRILVEAGRYCPDLSFWPDPDVVEVGALPFYQRLSLVRLHWAPRESAPEREVYAIYEPGLFWPIDEHGVNLERADRMAPLDFRSATNEETTDKVLEYLRLRIAFLGRAGDVLGRGGATQFHLLDAVTRGLLSVTHELRGEKRGAADAELVELSRDDDGPSMEWRITVLREEVDRKPEVGQMKLTIWLDGYLVIEPSDDSFHPVELVRRDGGEDPAEPSAWCTRLRAIIPAPARLRWEPLRDADLAQELRQSLAGAVPNPQTALIRVAALSFYRSFALAQIVDDAVPSDRDGQRLPVRYALYRRANSQLQLFPLAGASNTIHDANDQTVASGDRELVIDEDGKGAAYLDFFCWAMTGDEGQFVIPSTAADLPYIGTPSAEQLSELRSEQLRYGLHPVPRAEGPPRWAGEVVYGETLFKAEFEVDAQGVPTMVEDEPRLGNLPVERQTFGACGLTKLQLASLLRSAPSGSAPPPLPNPMVDGPTDMVMGRLYPVPPPGPAPGWHRDGRELTLARQRFDKPYEIPAIPDADTLVFVGCTFAAGLGAGAARRLPSLVFLGCVFGTPSDSDVALDLSGLTVQGNLELTRCMVVGRLRAPDLRVAGHLTLTAVRVGRDGAALRRSAPLDYIQGNNLRPQPELALDFAQPAIELVRARIDGELSLNSAGRLAGRRSVEGQEAAAVSDTSYEVSLVAGSVALSWARVGGAIMFNGVSCGGTVDLQSARASALFAAYEIALPAFRCRSLNAGAVQIAAGVLLDRARIAETCEFGGAHLKGYLLMRAAEVGGLSLYKAQVDNWIDLAASKIDGTVDLSFSRLKGYMLARRGPERGGGLPEPLRVRGNVFANWAEIAALEFRGVIIEGELVARNSRFGRLYLTLGAEAERKLKDGTPLWWPVGSSVRAVRLIRSVVGEDLELAGLRVAADRLSGQGRSTAENDEATAGVMIRQCDLQQNVRFSITDPCHALESRYQGDDRAATLRWYRPHGGASGGSSVPDQADVQTRILGDLDLRASKIGGDLELQNTTIEGRLRLDNASVGLNVRMNAERSDLLGRRKVDLETRCGELRTQGLTCGADLHLTGLRIQARRRRAASRVSTPGQLTRGDFLGRGARVRGSIELYAPGRDTSAPTGAQIEGVFDLSASQANRLILGQGNFSSAQKAKRTAPREGHGWRVNLERAKFSRLDIRRPPPPLDLTGIKVGRWELIHDRRAGEPGLPPDEARDYIEILSSMDPLDRSVWIDVEEGLRNQANNRGADRVFVAMNREGRKRAHAARTRELAGRESRWLRRLVFGVVASISLGRQHWAQFWHGLLFRFGTSPGRPFWLGNLVFWPLMACIVASSANITASDSLLSSLGARCRPEVKTAVCSKYRDAISHAEGTEVALHPRDLGADWTVRDGVSLWLRYALPILTVVSDSEWTPSEAPEVELGHHKVLSISPRSAAFWVATWNWIFLPLYLGFLTARLLRRGS